MDDFTDKRNSLLYTGGHVKNKISQGQITRFCKKQTNKQTNKQSLATCALFFFVHYLSPPFTFYFSSGNGGDAGRINFRARHINGEVRLSVCRGHGAEVALNGRAGPGKLAGTFGNKQLKQSRF